MTTFLDPYRQAEFSLAELAEAARDLLSRAGPGPSDERITTSPDARTVRYYQTLGVVDRPLRYRGRQALYGCRHLLQIVAVKLLQARGFSLAQVQQALQGAPTEQLERAALEGLTGAPAPTADPAPPATAPPAAPAPRTLLAVELAPGVTVTLDPALVRDPADVLARLSLALSPSPSTPSEDS